MCAVDDGWSGTEECHQPRREDLQIDPFRANHNLPDEHRKQRPHLRGWERGPATRDLGCTIDQTLLTGRVQPKLLGSFEDAVWFGEKPAKPLGNELFDLRGGDAQPAG